MKVHLLVHYRRRQVDEYLGVYSSAELAMETANKLRGTCHVWKLRHGSTPYAEWGDGHTFEVHDFPVIEEM